MEFRLTYTGRLLAHQDTERLDKRSLHVHDIRRAFHRQLKVLWKSHPVLREIMNSGASVNLYVGSGAPPLNRVYRHDGFAWLPMVTDANGLICKVDILMLRHGEPGRVVFDVDNRLKTLFDALRKPKGPHELGSQLSGGQVSPQADEDPFYVVLEDDKLITHLSVTSDILLEPVPDVPQDQAVRLVIDVTIKPYRGFAETAGYS